MKMQKVIVISGLTALMATFPLPTVAEDVTGQSPGVSTGEKPHVSQGQLQGNARDVADQSPRARMGEQSDISRNEMQDDVREIVREMVANALNGDVEDYVDYLSDEDRERMEANTGSEEFRGVSDSFTNRWQGQYSRSFESGLNELNVPITIQSLTDKTARVSVEGVELALVKGGWFDMAWKIDAPNSLTMETLHSRLNEAISRVESRGSEGSETQVLRKAISELLKPVAL